MESKKIIVEHAPGIADQLMARIQNPSGNDLFLLVEILVAWFLFWRFFRQFY